jgi:hypothetical protein
MEQYPVFGEPVAVLKLSVAFLSLTWNFTFSRGIGQRLPLWM